MDLKTIALNVMNCSACEFRKNVSETDKPTPGFGNPNAKIMLINLKTTQDAHAADKPVGIRNEVLLKKILSESGLKPSDVYFTNIVKCTGPITPKKVYTECKNTCINLHLKKEIEILNPLYIICFGSSSYEEVLKIRNTEVYKTYSLEEIYRHGISYISSSTELFSSIATKPR